MSSLTCITNRFTRPVTGNPFILPSFYMGDIPTFKIYLMQPSQNQSANQLLTNTLSFTLLSFSAASGLNLWMGIGPITGSTNSGTCLTYQDVWAYGTDNVGSFLTAQLPVNTANILAAVASVSTSSTFGIVLFDTDVKPRTVYQTSCTISNVPQNPGTVAGLPLPAVAYLTAAQQFAMFVRFQGNPNGSGIQLPSPDGTHTGTLSFSNDGTFSANES